MRQTLILVAYSAVFASPAYASSNGLGVLGWMFILGWVVLAAGVGVFVYVSAEVGKVLIMTGFGMTIPYLIKEEFLKRHSSHEQQKSIEVSPLLIS